MIKVFADGNLRNVAPIPTIETKALSAEIGFEKWLPFAAEYHEISKSIKDYFMVPCPIIISDLPNRNGVSFPKSELLRWNRTTNCCAYQGWKGCPVFKNHDWGNEANGRPAVSYGLIADVSIKPIKQNPDILKVIALLAIDRTKDPELAGRIERGELNSYSMGCTVEGYTCSDCGAELGECHHLNPKATMDFYERFGKLIYRECYGVYPYEVSSVEDPAYGSAIGEVRLRY